MNKIDLIILGIILVFTLIGYKRGLFMVVVSLVQYIIVLICSITCAPILSGILIENFNLDRIIIDFVINNEKLFSNVFSIISDEILRNIVGRIINVLAFIVLFIVLKVILHFVILLLNKIANLPILSIVNRLGGLILGAVEGIFLVYVVVLIVNWLPIMSGSPFSKALDESFICGAISYCVPELATEVINMVKLPH